MEELQVALSDSDTGATDDLLSRRADPPNEGVCPCSAAQTALLCPFRSASSYPRASSECVV